jgi:glycosyltransferase involved in cell wall biosynthesis
MKTLFVFAQMHYAHSNFADEVNAKKLKIGPYKKKLNLPFWYLKCLLQVPKNYDLYITEDPAFRVIIPIIKLFDHKAKFISIIAYEKPYMISKITPDKKNHYKNVLEKFDGLIAVSPMIKELLIDIGVQKKKISIARPSTKKETIEELHQCKPDLTSQNIIIIGNALDREMKGLDILVDAIKTLRRNYPKIKLFVVGGDNEVSREKYSDFDFINFLGFQRALSKPINNCSICVHIGRGDAYPISTQETMHAGLPTVVSKWTGTKEIVGKVDKKFVINPDKESAIKVINWYFKLTLKEKKTFSKKFRKAISFLTPDESRREFKNAINKLV